MNRTMRNLVSSRREELNTLMYVLDNMFDANSMHVACMAEAIDLIDTFFGAEDNGGDKVTVEDIQQIIHDEIAVPILGNDEEGPVLKDVVSADYFALVCTLQNIEL